MGGYQCAMRPRKPGKAKIFKRKGGERRFTAVTLGLKF